MEINTHNAEILLSAANKSHYPEDELPEIALAGRSNVGKSSFINTMLNRKNLARTSGKPGKTQLLNFFLIADSCLFHFPRGILSALVATMMTGIS